MNLLMHRSGVVAVLFGNLVAMKTTTMMMMTMMMMMMTTTNWKFSLACDQCSAHQLFDTTPFIYGFRCDIIILFWPLDFSFDFLSIFTLGSRTRINTGSSLCSAWTNKILKKRKYAPKQALLFLLDSTRTLNIAKNEKKIVKRKMRRKASPPLLNFIRHFWPASSIAARRGRCSDWTLDSLSSQFLGARISEIPLYYLTSIVMS